MVVFTLWRNFEQLYGGITLWRTHISEICENQKLYVGINFMSELEIHFMSELLYGGIDFRKIPEINNFMVDDIKLMLT